MEHRFARLRSALEHITQSRRYSTLERIRTSDTRFRKAVLYPLSYEGGSLSRPSDPTGT